MRPMSRRRFLQYGLGAGVALAGPWPLRNHTSSAALSGKLTKYLERVPLPGDGIVVATPTAPNTYAFTQTEISRQLHPHLPPTPLWAYDDGSGLGSLSCFSWPVPLGIRCRNDRNTSARRKDTSFRRRAGSASA